MSQEKAQLIAPLGVMTVDGGVTASGVITATTLDGNIVGSAKSLVNGANVSVGVITATSFTGNLTGNIKRLADSAPDVDAGVTTATSFVGNLTGSVTDLTSAPAITVGMVTATTLEGPVTGNITGNVSGLAAGLGVNYNGGWTGAGTSQINAGVVTATTFYGDGSNLDGVSSGPVSAQSIGITSATTAIDLSNGNLIHANQSSNTTVSFANTANGNVYFIREKDATATARTITWPDRIKWNGGSAPTLNSGNFTNEAHVFLLVTRDMGVTWYGVEIYDNPGGLQLWASGTGEKGQLGQGNTTQRSSPVQIGSAATWNPIAIRASELDCLMNTKTDGSLWGWGTNESGQLGLNQNNIRFSSPVQISGTTWKEGQIAYAALVSKTDGTLWSWGYGAYGIIGQNDLVSYSSPCQIPGTTWANVLGGTNAGYMSAVTKTDGTLWMWGDNRYGQLGINKSNANPADAAFSSPVQVGTDTTWATTGSDTMSGRAYGISAIKANGTLWSWGENYYGGAGTNLPHGDAARRSSPVQVGTDTTWRSINCGNNGATIATKTNGTLWQWGYNAQGQLGLNDKTNRSSPTQIGTGTDWSSYVSSTGSSSGGVKTDGTLWVWGINSLGQLGQNESPGNASTGVYSSPVQISGTTWNSLDFGGDGAALYVRS